MSNYAAIPIEVESRFTEGLPWADLLRYGRTSSKAHLCVQSVFALRVVDVVIEFVPQLHLARFWDLLSNGGGGVTGSAVRWVTHPAPNWRPKDLNLVVSLGGGDALRDFLTSWGCTESYLAPLIPNGRGTGPDTVPIRSYEDTYACAPSSWWFETPSGDNITVTETRERTVLHHLLGSRHSLQVVLLTRNVLIDFYPVHQVKNRAVLRAGGVYTGLPNPRDTGYRLNAQGARLTLTPTAGCQVRCSAVLRRLRGAEGVGIFRWTLRALDSSELAAYAGFPSKIHAVAWAWNECNNLNCPTYGFPRDLRVRDGRPAISDPNLKMRVLLTKNFALLNCTPVFETKYQGALFPTSCPSPLLVCVPLDYGIAHYRTMDDLRTYNWIKPVSKDSPRRPLFMSPTEVYGTIISMSQSRWRLSMGNSSYLLVFMTTTEDLAPFNFSLTPRGSVPWIVQGDVLLLIERERCIVDIDMSNIDACQLFFQRWWAALTEEEP